MDESSIFYKIKTLCTTYVGWVMLVSTQVMSWVGNFSTQRCWVRLKNPSTRLNPTHALPYS